MTVSSTTARVSYSGNGTTVAFAVPFYFLADSHLLVVLRSSTGVETTQALTTNYTVTGAGVSSGGTVTMTVAPASGVTLVISRNTPYTQATDLLPNDRLPAESLEQALDKLTMLAQQLDETSDRSIKFPLTDSTSLSSQLPASADRAGKYLKFTSTGAVTVGNLTDGFVNVKDYGATGNGSADDTAAFVAALAAASGKSLYVPGTGDYYKITDELTVPANTRVFGDGVASRIKQATAEKNGLIISSNCTIENLRISGDYVARNPTLFTKNNGIFAGANGTSNAAINFKVLHCWIDGWQSCGIQMRNCTGYEISGNVLYQNYYSFPSGQGNSSDICAYSDTAGGRAIITNNHCVSNNSQGIYFNAQGYDTDATITGNVCVTLDYWIEIANAADLDRRHGIIVSYTGGGGRTTCTGNVCRNTLVTGIYVASGAAGQNAISVTGNICSRNGRTTGVDASLAGGIYVNGGMAGLVISNNAVYDFLQSASSSVGAITYNDSDIDPAASALIDGNSVDTSIGYGIVLKGTPKNVTVSDNILRNVTSYDIYVGDFTGTAANIKNIRVSGNQTLRANADTSIHIDCGLSVTERFFVEDNILKGFNTTTALASNAGIFFRRSDTGSVTIRNNKISTFRFGIIGEQGFSGRVMDRLRVDYNELNDCFEGIALRGTTGATLVPCIGNRFSSTVTTKFGGAGFNVAGFEVSAIMDETRIQFESTVSPTGRPFVVGDFAINSAPSAGAATGWVCTVAGTPGTWITLAPTSFSALSDVAAAAPNDGNMLYFDNDTGKWTNTGAVSYDQAGSAFKLTGIAQKWGDGTRVGILSYDGTAVYLGSESNHPAVLYTNNTERARLDTSGNVIVGTAALATSATNGFPWIPSCAGAPTGAPTAPYSNAAALVVDTTNSRLYVRVGSTWKYVTLT